MARLSGGRPGFIRWLDSQPDPGWELLPLTHIAKGIRAEDIVQSGVVRATHCKVFGEPLAYFFYGRPAYRVGGDEAVKVEAACPFCLIFDPATISGAKAMNAFDTGAFNNRMYKHVFPDEMNVEDFSLDNDINRPNRLIAKVFSSRSAYFDGDPGKVVRPEIGSEPWEFHARAYLQLLTSRGRNEPDDRICSIEVVFGADVPVDGNLIAIVVPHTVWDGARQAPWLAALNTAGVEILTYFFLPGRHPDYYHALLEAKVREFFAGRDFI